MTFVPIRTHHHYILGSTKTPSNSGNIIISLVGRDLYSPSRTMYCYVGNGQEANYNTRNTSHFGPKSVIWLVLSDEQLSKRWPFPSLNNEERVAIGWGLVRTNQLWVSPTSYGCSHQPVMGFGFCKLFQGGESSSSTGSRTCLGGLLWSTGSSGRQQRRQQQQQQRYNKSNVTTTTELGELFSMGGESVDGGES